MIRLIVQVGDKGFRDGDKLHLNYRVFEFESAAFESLLKGDLLKGESPELRVVGVEVFDAPKVTTLPALPMTQSSLPLAVPVPSDPITLKATLAAKHANGHAPWWLGGNGDWRGRRRRVEPLKLP